MPSLLGKMIPILQAVIYIYTDTPFQLKIKGVDLDHLPQKACKHFMPPLSYLWRNRTSGAWVSRYIDMPTRSARDSAWGSEGAALKEVIRWAWSCYLDDNGYDRKRCPIADLWQDSEASGSGVASSSGA